MDQYKLKQLLENQFRTTYIKLSLLNRNGDILEEIQGRATGGSINIDGASSLRRSCNISLVSEKVNINDYQWALCNLFEVQIGLLDLDGKTINWFPQGIYVINSFNCSLGVNSYNINISGQDKMCQLNGEVSGALTAETDFGEYEEVDGKGNVISKKKLTLREIIWNIVHTYALEPASNIYIDLPDDSGVNLIEYRGDSPLYVLRLEENDLIKNITIHGDQKSVITDGETKKEKKISELNSYWHQGTMLDDNPVKGEAFEIGGTAYQVQRAEYGNTVGYEKTELTYAGKLVAAAGEAVTSILDKIRDMLGEYEYFYDVHGKFIFQKKKTYLKTLWNNSDVIEIYENGEYSYSFSDLSLFTSVANTPNLKQLRNDYTVWGTRKSITGMELPIHMRLAIDRKPNKYVSPWQMENGQFKQYSVTDYDWRELIYQMAWDYYNHNQDPDFDILLTAANSSWVTGGRTGYEQYYTDLLGFWRDLYNPDAAEDQEYVKTNYNSSVDKYTHKWKQLSTLPEDMRPPYSSWYVEKDGVKIRWMDSIDLWEGETPILLDAYIKPGVPFMKTSFESKPYRFKNSEGKFVTLEDLSKEQEAVKEVINGLYYKDKDNYIKLVQQKEMSQIAELSEVVDVYVLVEGAIERQKIIKFSNDEINEVSFENAYKEVNSPFYYKVDEEGSWIQLNFNTDRLYADEAVWPQEADQEWYILKEGQYQLYVNHLLETDKFIEDKLSLPGFEVSLLEQREINRDDLYRKKVTDVTPEGAEEKYEIITYENFFKDLVPSPSTDNIYNNIWYLDLESDPVLVADTPQFETYYFTDLHGGLKTDIEYKRLITYYTRVSDYYTNGKDINIRYWNKKVIETPETLNFWFDFIDPESVSTMRPFEVQKIGTRSLVKQEKGVKAIYYPKVPEMYFGAAAFQLPEAMKKYFVISSRGQSAFDAINNYLYNHTYITESITISSIPIYSLEPNTKILIDDNEHDIKGEYIVDKLTIPLTYNGMMTINATKAPEFY